MEIISTSFVVGGIIIMALKSKVLVIKNNKVIYYLGIFLLVSGIVLGSISLVNGIKKGWNSYQESPRRR